MNLNESFPVSSQKLDALRKKIADLHIDVRLIEESFIRGGGKGGQKINKTSNAVALVYPPLNLSVRCQKERQRSLNRFLALREMVGQIEMKISPETSLRIREIKKIQKQKDRRRRRR